jgi:octaprenyl-diphosphate synthase
MRHVAGQSKTETTQLTSFYAPVEEELLRVEELLQDELRSKYPFVSQLVQYAVRLGGKRLRPALLLLAAKATGEVSQAHLVLSAVVEMIHTATLIHDDVLDEASLRRHVDTVNARWNNEASVLLGDYLFTHAFYLASTLKDTYACHTIGQATNIVCEGELRQTHSAGDFDVTEDDYLDMIEAKTAALCVCCCQLGTHYAGADAELQENVSQFGRHFGIAFQITDDLLDLLGDEATVGKSLGTDLSKRKLTLPLIHALRQASADERAELVRKLTRRDNGCSAPLIPWLARLGAIQYAREKAHQYAERARTHLAVLPWSAAKDMLEGLTEFVVARRQ